MSKNYSSDDFDFIDTSTLLRIAKGAKIERFGKWGVVDLHHVTFQQWLKTHNLKPGDVPVCTLKAYEHFCKWAESKNMDYIASYRRFFKFVKSQFALKTKSHKKYMFVNEWVFYDQEAQK